MSVVDIVIRVINDYEPNWNDYSVVLVVGTYVLLSKPSERFYTMLTKLTRVDKSPPLRGEHRL